VTSGTKEEEKKGGGGIPLDNDTNAVDIVSGFPELLNSLIRLKSISTRS
jgi:hypothetical protein